MKTITLTLSILLACAAPVVAGDLASPSGPVILTVTGNISRNNDGGTARFDAAMLNALPSRSATMETPWTAGTVTFEGPLFGELLEAVGARGTRLVVRALNDYSAEVPIGDARSLATMLAMRMNGETMSVRDKGPLFLIYPFDTNPELYNEKYFSRSVWQISEIEVHD